MADDRTPPPILARTAATMVTLDRHPLLMQAHQLSVEVDKLPAHTDQTALITALGEWRLKLVEHLSKHGLLKE